MKTKCTLRYHRMVAWIFLSTPVRQGKFINWFKIVSLNTRENIHSPPEVNALVTFFHYLSCSHYILLLLHSVDYPNGECCSGPVFLWIIEEDQVSCGNTLSHDGKNTTNPGTLCRLHPVQLCFCVCFCKFVHSSVCCFSVWQDLTNLNRSDWDGFSRMYANANAIVFLLNLVW